MKQSKFLWFVVSIMFMVVPAAAQDDYPKAELFGGYSYINLDAGGFSDRGHAHGWGASLSGNFSKHIGVTADFAGQYRNLMIPSFPPVFTGGSVNFSTYEFLFGPRVTARSERVTGFAHALFGAAHGRLSGFSGLPAPVPRGLGRLSDTRFAMGFGGGVDVNAGKSIALRVIQVDYLPVRVDSEWAHNVRIQAGIVFRFGL